MGAHTNLQSFFNELDTIIHDPKHFIQSQVTPKIQYAKCKNCGCAISRDFYPDTKETTDWKHKKINLKRYYEDEGEYCSCGCDEPEV